MTETVGDTTGMPSTPTASSAFPIARMYYDAAGRVVQTWQIGTIETTSTYDVRSRLTGIAARTLNPSSDTYTPLFGAAYTFAPNSLVTSGTFERPASTTGQAALYRYAYTYDSVHRLTAADYQACTGTLAAATCPSTVRRYDVDEVTYDGDGNITRKLWRQPTVGVLDYQYDYVGTSNRLDSVTDDQVRIADFSYDPNGNVTSVTGSLYAHSSVIGRTNQPAWTTVGSATRRFLYDDTGWRVFEGGTNGGYTIRGAEGEELAFYSPSQVLQYHMLGPWGRRESSGTTVAYVRDMLGTPRAVAEASGTVRAMRDYYPFGLEMPGRVYVQGTSTREGFTGYDLDNETGLNYAGSRYYMPAIGRFTQIDRFASEYTSITPYAYAYNNPLYYTDPSGDTLVVVGSREEVFGLVDAYSDVGIGLLYNISSNNGIVTLTIVGVQRIGEGANIFAQDLRSLIGSEDVYTIKFVPNDDNSRLEEIERLGGAYFDPANRSINLSDNFIDNGFNMHMSRPMYYADRGFLRNFFGNPVYRRRSIPLGEVAAHEIYHAVEYSRGIRVGPGEYNSSEARTRNRINRYRAARGIPLRPLIGNGL